MTFLGLSITELSLMVGAFVASGMIRGFNGGAGANFITAPVLAAIIGPRETVPIVLGLNLLGSIQMLPGALPHVNWRETIPMGLAAALCLPLGTWVLFVVDEDTMRRAVAGTAIAFTLLMLTGWRYDGPRGPAVASAFGGFAGAISGAVTMGGPPVFLYLLSGREGAASNRATFIIFGTALQFVAVVLFAAIGGITERTLWLALVLFVPFVVSIRLGTMFFAKANEDVFRRVSLGFMLLISAAILVF